jgi:phage baseplate assembly protein V
MNELYGAVERLYRRVLLVVGRGRIKTGADDGPVQKQQVHLGAFETFDNIPRMSEYGFNSMPPTDSDAVLIFVGGNRRDGVIIGTGNQQFRMRNLKPGEVSISDNLGQSVYLTQSGIVIDGGGLPVLVHNTPSVTLDTPTVHMTGDAQIDGALTVNKNATVKQNVLVSQSVTAQGDVSDAGNKSMASMRQVFNLHTHPVTSVKQGTDSATTNKPNQSE